MTIRQPTSGRTIEKTLFLHAPPERVWRALTEKAELEAWFMTEATLDLRPGGMFVHRWPWGRKEGVFLEVDPPHRLVFTWNEEPRCAGATTMTFTLTAEGDGTRLHLVHTGYGSGDDWDALYQEHRSGWDPELEHLRTWVEEGIRKPWS